MESKIVIRFAMTKGEGEYPAGSEFSLEEAADIRRTLTFYLDYDPANAENDLTDVMIEECKIIYDGITYSDEIKYGLYIKDGELEGHPSPIIEFTLSRSVDVDDFRKCVWMSRFCVKPISRNESDQEPFFFEDHNGYSSVIDNSDVKEIIENLKESNLFSGKVISSELMENGITCLEMIGNHMDKKVAKKTSKKKTAGKTSMKTKGSSSSSLSEIVEIKIGSQIWMSTNINVDRFRNGDLIPEVKTDKEWKKVGNDKQPAWCYYQNKLANGTIYGKLYNWHAINDPRGLAPEGFHIPTAAEWKALSDYLGGHKIAGGKMKSTGTQYWKSPSPDEDLSDIEVTNESGFSGLPGGKRNDYGVFDYIGIEGNWWSSTESNKKIAISLTESISPAEYFRIYNNLSHLGYCEGTKGSGFSIRCLRD